MRILSLVKKKTHKKKFNYQVSRTANEGLQLSGLTDSQQRELLLVHFLFSRYECTLRSS